MNLSHQHALHFTYEKYPSAAAAACCLRWLGRTVTTGASRFRLEIICGQMPPSGLDRGRLGDQHTKISIYSIEPFLRKGGSKFEISTFLVLF